MRKFVYKGMQVFATNMGPNETMLANSTGVPPFTSEVLGFTRDYEEYPLVRSPRLYDDVDDPSLSRSMSDGSVRHQGNSWRSHPGMNVTERHAGWRFLQETFNTLLFREYGVCEVAWRSGSFRAFCHTAGDKIHQIPWKNR